MGIFLSAGVFFYSSTPAQASNVQNTIPQFALADFPPASIGEIMMDYTSVHVPSQDKTYYECMVWNKKTGVSKLYYYSYDKKAFVAYEDNVQLPSSPVSKKGNENIMMDYTSVHVPSQDKTYYECMVWNEDTGESTLYYYSYDSKSFKAYESNVQLPSSPVTKKAGEKVMMDYTSVHVPSQDKTYYECMVWNKNTGKSTLYYYSYESKSFKAYEDNVQLPGSPLE